MAKKEKVKIKNQMSVVEVAAYSLGLFGFQAIIGLLNSYQAEFCNAAFAADFAVVGILVLVAKIVSAAFDPVVGTLIERGNSKKGKLKPFILYAVFPFAITTVLLFVKLPFTGTAAYVYIFIITLIWCLAMTLGDVPSQGIAAVLTTNPDERTNVVSIANTAKQIGFSACAVIVPIICLLVPGGSPGFTEGDPISTNEYFWGAVFTAVFGCGLFSLIYFLNKERVPYKGEKMGIKEMFAAMKGNKPLVLVIVSYFLGFGRQMAMAIQVQTSNVIFGNQNYLLLLGITTAIGSMLSMAICPVLIKKFNEKTAYLILSIYGFVVSMAAFFVGTENKVLMFIFLFLIGLQFSAVTLMPMIMTADCVDAYEVETGRRTEGSAYALLALTIKVCLALGAAVGLVCLSLAKYDAGAVGDAICKSPKTVWFAYTALPGIFSLLSTIPMFKYDIIGDKKKKIAETLAAKRG